MKVLNNRVVRKFVYEILDSRGWSIQKFATESGVKRTLLSAQLSGVRPIGARQLMKYLHTLDHQERPKLLAAWLRDYMDQELVEDLLNVTGEGLSLDVTQWAPTLEEDDKAMLAWWAREIKRDGELGELFKLLSAKAGYRPRRTVTGPVKRWRRRGGGAGLVACLLCCAFMFAPTPRAHARQARAAALALRGRQCFRFPAAEAT